MPRIPTISTPQVQRAEYPGATMSLESALAPARGTMAIAQGIGQLGQVAGEFAIRRAQARDAATLSEMKRTLAESSAEFGRQLETNPDSDTWKKDWEKHKQTTQRAVFANSKLGPDGRRAAAELFEDWSSRNGIQVANQAKLRQVADARLKFTTSATTLAQQGDLAGAMQELETAKNFGLFSAAQEADWKQKIHETSEWASANMVIDSDPVNAEKAMTAENYPSLNPRQLVTLQKTARQELAALRNQNALAFQEEVINVLENNADPKDLQARMKQAMDDGVLHPSQYAINTKRLSGTLDAQFDPAAGAMLWDQIEKVDVRDKEAVLQLRKILSVVDPYIRQDLDKALDQRVNPTQAQTKNPTAAFATIDGMHAAGVFGTASLKDVPYQQAGETKTRFWEKSPAAWIYRQLTGTEPATYLDPAVDEKGDPIFERDAVGQPIPTEEGRGMIERFQNGQAKKYMLRQHMLDWYQKNPNATAEQQNSELRRITQMDTDILGAEAVYGMLGFSDLEAVDDGN